MWWLYRPCFRKVLAHILHLKSGFRRHLDLPRRATFTAGVGRQRPALLEWCAGTGAISGGSVEDNKEGDAESNWNVWICCVASTVSTDVWFCSTAGIFEWASRWSLASAVKSRLPVCKCSSHTMYSWCSETLPSMLVEFGMVTLLLYCCCYQKQFGFSINKLFS